MMRMAQKLIVAGDRACVIQPKVAKLLGRSVAHILQHIHYTLQNPRLGKMVAGEKWIYNTYDCWQEELQIYSLSTVRRAINKLEQMGILVSNFLSPKHSDRTKWYRIDYSKLDLLEQAEVVENPFKMGSTPAQNEQIHIEEQKNQTNKIINPNESQKIDVNKIFEILNNFLGEGRDLKLTKKRAQLLMAAFKHKFDRSLDKWELFCKQIAASDFLNGRTKHAFKASLEWLLRFDVIQRIFEGDFGIKALKIAGKTPETCKEVPISFEELPGQQGSMLRQLHEKLLETFGRAIYSSWFRQVEVITSGARMALKAPSQFWKNYVQTHFGNELRGMTLGIC